MEASLSASAASVNRAPAAKVPRKTLALVPNRGGKAKGLT
jgi:hypothetical protein